MATLWRIEMRVHVVTMMIDEKKNKIINRKKIITLTYNIIKRRPINIICLHTKLFPMMIDDIDDVL